VLPRSTAVHNSIGATTPELLQVCRFRRFPVVRVATAPGRVNLIGDHTDYQDGFCVPMAIDRAVTVAARVRPDRRVLARSDAFDGVVEAGVAGPEWGRIVTVACEVIDHNEGTDLEISSTVPAGSGLSSSAALEVALLLALGDLSGRELALAAQEVEHRASGVPCGVMDQMASVFGRAGHALLLDCRSLDVEPVPMPPGIAVVVVNSGPRTLAESAYAQRRAACEDAAERVGVPALRDATLEQVGDDPYARHVVSENARVVAFVDALRRGDVRECGALMLASHGSLRDDFRVSTPDLDEIVNSCMGLGAYGARLTGAGFGGCVVALFDADRADDAAARMQGWVVHAADGARVVESQEQ
jgi:galactokinase